MVVLPVVLSYVAILPDADVYLTVKVLKSAGTVTVGALGAAGVPRLASAVVKSPELIAVVQADPFLYKPSHSVARVCIMVAALRADETAAESCAFERWLRNVGMAIAARIPMMITTTRSSIRVKPPYSEPRR
jgi:hypothetical protein